jgi:hypothetical protein
MRDSLADPSILSSLILILSFPLSILEKHYNFCTAEQRTLIIYLQLTKTIINAYILKISRDLSFKVVFILLLAAQIFDEAVSSTAILNLKTGRKKRKH